MSQFKKLLKIFAGINFFRYSSKIGHVTLKFENEKKKG